MKKNNKKAAKIYSILTRAAIGIPVAIAVAAIAFYLFYMYPRYTVPILMYHSVSDVRNEGYPQVTPVNFEKQMKFLSDNKYSVITLEELVKGIKEKKKFPHNTVVITFDDGYKDNYVNAFPILAKYKFPATIAIIPTKVGVSGDIMNWDQVMLMMQNGIDFAAHARHHDYLPADEDPAKLWEEIAMCKTDIELKTGREVKFFSYPLGAFNGKVKEAVEKAGYLGALTTNRGFDRLNRDVYQLNRIKTINEDSTVPLRFRVELSGYYNFFRSPRNTDDPELKKTMALFLR